MNLRTQKGKMMKMMLPPSLQSSSARAAAMSVIVLVSMLLARTCIGGGARQLADTTQREAAAADTPGSGTGRARADATSREPQVTAAESKLESADSRARTASSEDAASSVERARRALAGRHLQLSFRRGGVLYGTYYTQDIDLCSGQRYQMDTRTERTTVLGNTQRGGWFEEGRWRITSQPSGPSLELQASGGGTTSLSFALTGRSIRFVGISVVFRGAARCE